MSAIEETVGRDCFGGDGLVRMFLARERDASRVLLSVETRDGLTFVVVRTIFGSGFVCGFD
jgi:hypothetical protein